MLGRCQVGAANLDLVFTFLEYVILTYTPQAAIQSSTRNFRVSHAGCDNNGEPKRKNEKLQHNDIICMILRCVTNEESNP